MGGEGGGGGGRGEIRGDFLLPNATYKTCNGLSMDLGVLPSSHRLRKKPGFLHSKCLSHRRGPCFVRLRGRCCVDGAAAVVVAMGGGAAAVVVAVVVIVSFIVVCC